MFSEQIQIQERYRKEAQPHELKKLDENSELLAQRLQALIECKRNLDSDLERQRKENQILERDINSSKLEINSLVKQEKRLKQMMLAQNITEQLIKQILDEGIIAWTNQDIVNHLYDETTWHLPTFTRNDAERSLNGCPTGTFLIRDRSAGDYALSIACNDVTKHCIIYQTQNSTFGFAEPYNIYTSLKELVLHYSTNSLEEHNDSLQTTLKYPYYSYVQTLSSNSNSSNNSTATSNSANNQ